MRFATHSLLLLSTLSAASSAHSPDQHPLIPPSNSPPLSTHHEDKAPSYEAPSYRHALLSLHRALVNVPSISGSEAAVADLLAHHLRQLNYTVELQHLPPSSKPSSNLSPKQDSPARYNILAWPGPSPPQPPTKFTNRVLITSHIDVVPPFLPYRINGTVIPPSQPLNFTTLPLLSPSTRISGRGTVDAKAAVAAQITATSLLLASGAIVPRDVVLLFVVGEETIGDGMKFFSASLGGDDDDGTNSNDDDSVTPAAGAAKRPRLRAAVFGEPTEGKLACGHKGIVFGAVRATGRAAHSGYPWLGKSAIEGLVRGLRGLLDADLDADEGGLREVDLDGDLDLGVSGKGGRFGKTTVNVGVIEGGVAANVIAKEATARIAVRVAVGNQTTGRGIVEERMKRVLAGVDEEGLRLELEGGYGPVECECRVDGFETMIANYGTDVPNLDGDHPSYLYGPGSILVAHGDDEGLTVKDMEDAVEGYKKLIKHAVEAHD